MDFLNLTQEQIKTLTASMANPIKISNEYLSSKVYNDIIRENGGSSIRLRDETFYQQAVAFEAKCEYSTLAGKPRRGRTLYRTTCIAGPERAIGGGLSPEIALYNAKQKAIYLIEQNLAAKQTIK